MTMCRLNLNFKILSEILVGHTWGVNCFLTMYRLNFNFKILVEILVSHTWEVNHFDHVQAKSEL